MSLALAISLVLFLAASVHLMIGVYILSLGTPSSLNRSFFLVSLSLCVWAFSFSIASSAPDYETALFWRRMSSLGWGTLYSLLLHFFLILTGSTVLLTRRWLHAAYAVLYVPAIVTVLVFGFHGGWLVAPYTLVATTAGWVIVSDNTPWDWLFSLYAGSFVLLSLLLLWHWGRRSTSAREKSTARLLATSLAAAAILGTLTDIVRIRYMPFAVPRLAPVIALIPAAAIVFAIKRYGLMAPTARSHAAKAGQILSEASRERFSRYMSLAFILGGMLNTSSFCAFFQIPLGSVLRFSAILLLIAVMLQIIDRLPLKADYRDTAASCSWPHPFL